MSSLPPVGERSKSAANNHTNHPEKPNHYLSMADYQSAKTAKLRDLKSRSNQHRQMWLDLGSKHRQEQLRQGWKMCQGSPLAVDQAAEYEKKRAKMMQKYAFKQTA
jgi:hypothetical protein